MLAVSNVGRSRRSIVLFTLKLLRPLIVSLRLLARWRAMNRIGPLVILVVGVRVYWGRLRTLLVSIPKFTARTLNSGVNLDGTMAELAELSDVSYRPD